MEICYDFHEAMFVSISVDLQFSGGNYGSVYL